MFEFLKTELIPEDRIIAIGRPLVATVDNQMAAGAASGNLERTFPDCLKSGYLIGYIFGLSTAFGSIACKEHNAKKSATARNIQRLYESIVRNAFPPDQFGNYMQLFGDLVNTQPSAFKRGAYDGNLDSQMRIEHGKFIKFLAGRLISLDNPRDDLFVLPYSELSARAQIGDADAQLEMAARHSKGRDVEKNMQKAASLYLLATLAGHPRAKSLFHACAELLTPNQRTETRNFVESFDFDADRHIVIEALDGIFAGIPGR